MNSLPEKYTKIICSKHAESGMYCVTVTRHYGCHAVYSGMLSWTWMHQSQWLRIVKIIIIIFWGGAYICPVTHLYKIQVIVKVCIVSERMICQWSMWPHYLSYGIGHETGSIILPITVSLLKMPLNSHTTTTVFGPNMTVEPLDYYCVMIKSLSPSDFTFGHIFLIQTSYN